MQAATVEHIGILFFQIGGGCIDQFLVGIDEEHQHIGRHLVGAVGGVEQLREMNLIGIAGFVLDIASCATYHHFLKHLVTQLLIDGVNSTGKVFGTQGAALRHKALELLYPRGKGVGNVSNAIKRAAGGILEQQQLVLDIFRSIVERCGRKQ